jgi:hypothetical protein
LTNGCLAKSFIAVDLRFGCTMRIANREVKKLTLPEMISSEAGMIATVRLIYRTGFAECVRFAHPINASLAKCCGNFSKVRTNSARDR